MGSFVISKSAFSSEQVMEEGCRCQEYTVSCLRMECANPALALWCLNIEGNFGVESGISEFRVPYELPATRISEF